VGGLLRRLAGIAPSYVRTAWLGLVRRPSRSQGPLLVVQAAVLSEGRVLLSVREDLRGWELPGGNPTPGERDEVALRREVREETGLDVEVERRVGDYVRTGFLPHVARVFLCRVEGGVLRPSHETPRVAWFEIDALPETLFPWYRTPLRDALAELPEPVERHEHQGVRAIWDGMRIDLRMRATGDRAR
jgi:8-oxo-dGTP diphosphatase